MVPASRLVETLASTPRRHIVPLAVRRTRPRTLRAQGRFGRTRLAERIQLRRPLLVERRPEPKLVSTRARLATEAAPHDTFDPYDVRGKPRHAHSSPLRDHPKATAHEPSSHLVPPRAAASRFAKPTLAGDPRRCLRPPAQPDRSPAMSAICPSSLPNDALHDRLPESGPSTALLAPARRPVCSEEQVWHRTSAR